jgi:uncharacterized membrane protein
MQGFKRKIIYAITYEVLAIALASFAIGAMSGNGIAKSTTLAVLSSGIAVCWNLAFNTAFEYWEGKQSQRYRSWTRRMLHALGFEGGLSLMLVPVFAWWLNIGLWQALWMDAALLAFFLLYTLLFNRAFDHCFGLPDSVTKGNQHGKSSSPH